MAAPPWKPRDAEALARAARAQRQDLVRVRCHACNRQFSFDNLWLSGGVAPRKVWLCGRCTGGLGPMTVWAGRC